MRNLLHAFVRNTVFANLLMALIVIGGLAGSAMMIRELLPSFAIETVMVRIPYPGAGPEEVEEGITLKVEKAIETVQGIKEFTTISAEGMHTATIDVNEGEDVQLVKDRIADRINAIQDFPDDAENPSISELIIRRDTLVIAVHGELPERQLRELAENVREELIALPEVSDVEVRGIRDYEISIEVSEADLRRYGLTFEDVARAVRQNSLNLPAGELRSDREEIKIRTLGRKYTGNEYRDIVLITRPDGTTLTLADIADIRDGFVEEEISSRYNGDPSVSLTVYNSESEDALQIAAAVKEYIERKNAELPETVSLSVWLNGTRFISERIELLLRNGLVGLLLVFLLLWIFLDLRLAFWVSLGIPISLSGALLLMYLFGATINMISLFAMLMVLGIIVDDAIIVGEAIYVHRKQGKNAIRAAVDGTMEVALPVFAAVITTIVAFVPLLFVSGIMGKFISVIPFVVICALAISLIEGLIILPAHLNHLPDIRNEKPRDGFLAAPSRFRMRFNRGLENFVERIYKPFIRLALSWRYVSFAIMFAVTFVTVGMVKGGFIKFLFFPDLDTDFLIASVEFPEGTTFETTEEAVLRMEDGLWAVAEELETETGEPLVVGLEANIGHSIGMDNGMSEATAPQIGEIRVELLPSERRGVSYETITRLWQEQVGQIPGALSLSYGGAEGGPGGMPIEVWFTGDDLDMLRAAADGAKEQLREYAGVYQIEDDFRPGERELRVALRPEATVLGLTLGDVARQVRQGFYGEEALRVQRGREEVKVWVRYPREERRSLADIDDIRIRTPDGTEVPLEEVADITMDTSYTTITRQEGERRVRVTADIFNDIANPTDVQNALTADYLADVPREFPGVTASLEGEKRENQESMGSLIVGFPLALMAIYLIIATLFRSYIQPVIIMITVPFGIIGALWGHLLLGYEVTIMSMFGMVALAGVVVNDAIVTIEAVNQRLASGMSLMDALVDGSARRFRAVMLTTLTTVGGLTPLIVEQSLQAQFLIPMALTVASGVAFATLLTLGLLPCLMYILNDIRRGVTWLVRGVWISEEDAEPATRREVSDEEFLGEGPVPSPAG